MSRGSAYSVSFNQLSGQADDDEPAIKRSKLRQETRGITDDRVLAGIRAGNIQISKDGGEVMELSESARGAKTRHDELLKQVEAKRRARTIMVPTNDGLVRKRLREVAEPITLFGELAPGRRERLREILARLAVDQSQLLTKGKESEEELKRQAQEAEVKKKAYLVEGTQELRQARIAIATFSIPRAKKRIEEQLRKRHNPKEGEVEADLRSVDELEGKLRLFANVASQVGDDRPISSCSWNPQSTLLATASWSGICKVWDVSNSNIVMQLKNQDERVTDIVWHPQSGITNGPSSVNLATCSVDGIVALWGGVAAGQEEGVMKMEEEDGLENGEKSGEKAKIVAIAPIAKLEGHQDRCSRLAFHPSGKFLLSASYDCTWRMWDVARETCILTQGGHSRPVFGVALNGDGSLAVTGDLGGNVRLWDLRSGKSVLPLKGHTKQVLCASFHPGGYTIATGSDDHTIKIWDLRKKMAVYSIPAHSSLISNVQYQPGNGEFIVSSSYDNTAKIWSSNDYTLLRTLTGHEKYVMHAEISPDSQTIATTSYDRTWKLWSFDEATQKDLETNLEDM